MAAIITAIGSVVTGATSWISAFLEMITAEGNELLLFFCIIPVVGLGVGLLRRLINVN